MEKKKTHKILMAVDRIEEGYAILIPVDEPEEIIHMPVRYLPGVAEGDIVEFSFKKDENATREAGDRIGLLKERLLNR
jgi:hypothetical protein